MAIDLILAIAQIVIKNLFCKILSIILVPQVK